MKLHTAHQRRDEWKKKRRTIIIITIQFVCSLFIHFIDCLAKSKIVLFLLLFSFDIWLCSRVYSVQCSPHAANSIVFTDIEFYFHFNKFYCEFCCLIFFVIAIAKISKWKIKRWSDLYLLFHRKWFYNISKSVLNRFVPFAHLQTSLDVEP